MSPERTHRQVVAGLLDIQARLRGESPSVASEGVILIEGDIEVRAGGESPRTWQVFPEVNLCPQGFDLTIDDRIALLQHDIADRERQVEPGS
jgi:hypothetical protein